MGSDDLSASSITSKLKSWSWSWPQAVQNQKAGMWKCKCLGTTRPKTSAAIEHTLVQPNGIWTINYGTLLSCPKAEPAHSSVGLRLGMGQVNLQSLAFRVEGQQMQALDERAAQEQRSSMERLLVRAPTSPQQVLLVYSRPQGYY